MNFNSQHTRLDDKINSVLVSAAIVIVLATSVGALHFASIDAGSPARHTATVDYKLLVELALAAI